MKNLFLKSIVVFTAVLMASCASIFTKTMYPVNFTSNPTEAAIKITDSKGISVFSGTTPATVSLSSSKGFFSNASYEVEYTKEGYEPMKISLTATIDGWYFGNILIGGLIGMLIVDPATGAMWRLDSNVNADLVPFKSATASLQILDVNDIPEIYKDQLIAIN